MIFLRYTLKMQVNIYTWTLHYPLFLGSLVLTTIFGVVCDFLGSFQKKRSFWLVAKKIMAHTIATPNIQTLMPFVLLSSQGVSFSFLGTLKCMYVFKLIWFGRDLHSSHKVNMLGGSYPKPSKLVLIVHHLFCPLLMLTHFVTYFYIVH